MGHVQSRAPRRRSGPSLRASIGTLVVLCGTSYASFGPRIAAHDAPPPAVQQVVVEPVRPFFLPPTQTNHPRKSPTPPTHPPTHQNQVPQQALEQVLYEDEHETVNNNPFSWLLGRIRASEGSVSQAIRNRVYQDEVERLNPTCAVIGFFAQTIPVCPFVRRLEKCTYALLPPTHFTHASTRPFSTHPPTHPPTHQTFWALLLLWTSSSCTRCSPRPK